MGKSRVTAGSAWKEKQDLGSWGDDDRRREEEKWANAVRKRQQGSSKSTHELERELEHSGRNYIPSSVPSPSKRRSAKPAVRRPTPRAPIVAGPRNPQPPTRSSSTRYVAPVTPSGGRRPVDKQRIIAIPPRRRANIERIRVAPPKPLQRNEINSSSPTVNRSPPASRDSSLKQIGRYATSLLCPSESL